VANAGLLNEQQINIAGIGHWDLSDRTPELLLGIAGAELLDSFVHLGDGSLWRAISQFSGLGACGGSENGISMP